MKKRCAIYIRASEVEDNRDLQQHELLGYAKERGLQVMKAYEDYGVGPRENRTQLMEILAGARMGRFDFILVWRLDRMFLSHRHLITVLQEIQPMGIGLVSVRDKIDTFSEHGNLVMHLFQIFDNFHRIIMAERAQAGINGSRAKGNFFGRLRTIDREKLAKLMHEGHTITEMAKRLNCSPAGVYQIKKKILLEAATKNASWASL